MVDHDVAERVAVVVEDIQIPATEADVADDDVVGVIDEALVGDADPVARGGLARDGNAGGLDKDRHLQVEDQQRDQAPGSANLSIQFQWLPLKIASAHWALCSPRPMPWQEFEWDGNHPALNFVNTLDERLSAGPVERLGGYLALVSFARQAGLIDAKTGTALAAVAGEPAAKDALRDAVGLREACHRVLRATLSAKAPASADVGILNGQMSDAHANRVMSVSAKEAAWGWREPHAIRRPVWELALAIEDLMFHDQRGKVRTCAAGDCGVLFIDLSKAGRRRWCSMSKCGNQHKAHQFRSRRA